MTDKALALSLPTPPDSYSAQDQRELRRALGDAFRQVAVGLNPSLPWVTVRSSGGNDTGAIQGAIDSVAAVVPTAAGTTTGGGIVLLTDQNYTASGLVLKYGVHVLGLGQQATKITPAAGSTDKAVWLLNTGIVAYSSIRGMSLIGRNIAGQHGIYLHAVPTTQAGATQGGWWYSELSELSVEGFAGEQIWLHGGDDSFLGPHQFLVLHHIEADAPVATRSLRLSGQVDHLKCVGACRFDGPGFTAGGTNILLERTVDTSGANNGDNAPHDVEFRGITTQSNTLGISIQRAQNVTIAHNHFEALEKGVLVDVSAQNIVIEDNDFSNTGKNGGATGYCVTVVSGHCVVRDNYFAYGSSGGFGQPNTHYVRTGGSLIIEGKSHRDIAGVKTTAAFLQINAAATLDVTGYDHVLVNTGATHINTITSFYSVPGNLLFLKAHNGTIILESGGNIYFDSSPNRYQSPLTVPADTMVTLLRMNLAGTEIWYILAGAENANYVRPFGSNGATPQTSYPSGGAAPAGGAGTAAGGWDTAAHRDAAITLLNNIRSALVANGIMS